MSSMSRTSRRIAILAGLVAAISIIILIADPIRVANQRARSMTNLKQIGGAMQVYHDAYKRFPADIRGRDGEAQSLKPPIEALGGHHPGGFNALLCDGSVRFIRETINRLSFRALITRDGGEVISDSAF